MKGISWARRIAAPKRHDNLPRFSSYGVALMTLAVVSTPGAAAMINPISYEMLNGQSSSVATYHDSTYDGAGDPTANLSELTDGTGELTDGVIPDTGWNTTPDPFVGWLSVTPSIRFNFAAMTKVDQIDMYFDDSGSGGVEAPTRISLTDGMNAVSVPVPDDGNRGQVHISLNDLGFEGEWVNVTIVKDDEAWVMLSEVQFEGTQVPEPTTMVGGLLGIVLTLVAARRKRSCR